MSLRKSVGAELFVLAAAGGVWVLADSVEKVPLIVIADTDTPVPGQGGATFQTFFQLDGVDPDISGGYVVFFACCPTGIYSWLGGKLDVVVDLNSTFPGTGNPLGFVSGGNSPSVSGENVAFACSDGRPGPGAICAVVDGVLTSIAKSGETLVPGTNETFGTFFASDGASPSISGENVAFTGKTPSSAADWRNGIYAMIDGELITIADNTTPIPGQPGLTFQNFGQLSGTSPSISGENVAFVGVWSSGSGVYAYSNGQVQLVADTTMPLPPGSAAICGNTFGKFEGSRPSIYGNTVVFHTVCGVYAYTDGQVSIVADSDTPAPGSAGTFGGFPVSPVMKGPNIGIGAGAEGLGSAVYAYIDGQFELIASKNTRVPGNPDAAFNSFYSSDTSKPENVGPSMSGRNVVFVAQARLPGKAKQFVTGVYGRILEPGIPALSVRSLVALAALMLTAGGIILARRQDK